MASEGERVGTARVDLIIDNAQWEAAVSRSQSLLTSMGEAGESAYNKLDSRQKRATTSLLQWAEAQGKTAEEQKLINAAMRGVPVEILDGVRNRIQQQRDATEAARRATEQLAAAERDRAASAASSAAAAETDRLREQQRVVAALTKQFHELEAAERQMQEFGEASQIASKNDALREQQRVVSALTKQFHELEAAERQSQEFNQAAQIAAENDRLREQQRVVSALTKQFHELEAAERAEASVKADREQFITSLQRQSQEFGRSRSEILEMRAAQMGLTREAAPFIASLRQQENQLYGTSTQLNRYGLSQKQVSAALRGVPAQITDIAVSLQGGQAPLTVLLQQGGQLKDMFGGIRPAAEALGGALLRLINPYTLMAAAIGTVLYASYQASEQLEAFDVALIRSGNRAMTTAENLNDLADKIGDIDKVTRGKAVESLAAFAEAGRLSGEQLENAARATSIWSAATGDEVSKVVDKFNEIGKDPVAALLKLHDAENFLKEGQIERIAALVEEGRQQDAAREGVEIYANVLEQRGNEVVAKLSEISKLWMDVKDSASQAWQVIVAIGEATAGAVNNAMSANRNLASNLLSVGNDDSTVGDPVARLKMLGGAFKQYATDYLDATEQINAKKPKVILIDPAAATVDGAAVKKALEERKKNLTEWTNVTDANLSKREAQLKEEARITELGTKLGKSQVEIEKQIAESRRKFAEQNKPKNDTSNNDGKTIVAQLRDMIDVSNEAAGATEKLSTVQKALIKIQNDLDDPTKRITASERERIAVLMETARAADVDARKAQEQKKAREELDKLNKELAASEKNAQAQVNADLMEVGRGGRAVDQLRRQLAIEKEYQDGLRQLRDSGVASNSQSYKDQEARLTEHRDRMLEIERGYQSDLAVEQGSFTNGFVAALEDYQATNENVAAAMKATWTDVFNGMGDAIVEFARTGKLSISDLVNDAIAQLLRLATNQAIAGLFGNVLGMMGGGGVGAMGSAAVTTGTQNINAGMMRARGFALGGVPAADISAYSGTVVNKPTFFANGGNVMGEAGDEGIFPLKRDSSGRLGVSAVGGGGDDAPKITINIIGGSGQAQTESRQTGKNAFEFDVLLDQIDNGLATKASQGNSSFVRAQQARFPSMKEGV